MNFNLPESMKQERVFRLLVRKVRTRVSDDRARGRNDAVVVITGDPGSGKSTLMIWLCKVFAGKKFDLDEHLLYSPKQEDVTARILNDKPEEPVGLDEAIKVLAKQRWYTPAVRFLTTLFNICRKQRKIVILCIPRFQDLPEYFRNDRVMFRLHIVERGMAALFVRLPTPYGTGGWHWDKVGQKWEKFVKIRASSGLRPLPEDTIQFFKKNDPTYVGVFHFPLLPEDVEKEYMKRVDQVKYDLKLESFGSTPGRPPTVENKELLIKAVTKMKDEKVFSSQQEMAEFLGVSQPTLSRLLQSVTVKNSEEHK